MKVIKGYPPIFKQIAKVFPVKGVPGILYAWGDTLWNPSSVPVTPWIMAHEEVHGERQLAIGVEEWWKAYLANKDFRLIEEVAAHRAEWASYKEKVKGEHHWPYLATIATRLSSPLYGRLVDYPRAVTLINGDDEW